MSDPARLTLSFQPVVDTVTGEAAGWEALSRFLDPGGAPSAWGPAEWFGAAQGTPDGVRLEALALRRALGAVAELPPDTFLTVNVSPAAITSSEVAAVLSAHDDLSRVIVEITETDAVRDVGRVNAVCAGIRAAGGSVAVDDAGAGYAGLTLIAHLRPQLVKVDRELISGCDSDPVKLSLIEVLGVWASGMDAWLLAEGVETAGEYAAVVALGVPLVQGWFTGKPAAAPTGVAPEVLNELRRQRARVALRDSIASVMATWPVVPAPELLPAAGDGRPGEDGVQGPLVLADHGWPVALVLGGPGGRRCPVSLRVRPSEDVRETLRRAMAREPDRRFDPVVVTDAQGWTVGVATLESLIARATEPAT